ncbi:hypothetical protein PR003_g15896 [Phytophthora rubi]|uniref:Uncharacterized protein n=1 Tax=Phytophthora rubi TaxID=129364 RepID=A0A6A4EUW4_9STRA|nr:hypothetical protein PR001_g15237 [Phytophthora rubi]KAE9327971.1 hypothetical protein PR003_g15896 [Phytophthora rubi]
MEFPADASVLAPLPLALGFCTLPELRSLALVSRDVSSTCEPEWRLRTLARFGELRFATGQWRRLFLLRSQFRHKAVEKVTARVYLMNNRGETRFFPIERGTPLMCSRERAVVYNRCKRMFDLSLRINRSIQEISTLIGMVSVDEARGLLNEHISLMTSVAALRGSLNFESELFQIFPAPVLLDTNSLLRVTHKFQDAEDAEFLQSSLLMMQVWASIDGLIYRPLAPPATIQPTPDRIERDGENVEEIATYASLKLHELSGMTISIDDNTLRYRLQGDELCVNTLVSNTYLLYLFNPLQYRPLDWTFDAMLQVGETRYVLPVQREGVFLNTTSYALRVFLSYGKLPEKPQPQNGETSGNQEQETASAEVAGAAAASATPATGGARGAEDSEPLEIPYDGQREIFAFHLTATNRISKKTHVVASKATCLSLLPPPSTVSAAERRLRQLGIASSSSVSDDEEDADESDTSSTPAVGTPPTLERHVHLPFDAMICYCFAPSCRLQYVEFASGFEPLMHILGVADFLPDTAAVN